jgi:hypothetical protein
MRRMRRVGTQRDVSRERLAGPLGLPEMIVEQSEPPLHFRDVGVELEAPLVAGERLARELVAIGHAARALRAQAVELARHQVNARVFWREG